MAKEYNDRDYEKYAQALQKAINGHECPVKQKHVRSAIIGTFQTQSAKIFWAYGLRLPVMDDRIVAWKLCHVAHKVLREGHPLCLVDSQRHRADLDEIGKLWGHLKEGYGKMIRIYTTLLINKLEFHRRNPRFPGHLGVTPEELESIGGNDVNNYFDMSIEMFDYIDNILALQDAVFGSLNMARSNSMTSAGQCRLAPLIPCIQDASRLYDYCVKMLFKLHMSLPPDILAGHRERFFKQFRALKKFYESTSNLQYFKDLIAIPPLPENPPNFLIMGDFRTYVTQEVVVPQEPEEEPVASAVHEENLIDTEIVETVNNQVDHTIQLSLSAHHEMVREREYLRSQCEKLREKIAALMAKNQTDMRNMQSQICALEHDLATRQKELEHEKQVRDELMTHNLTAAQTQDSEQKQFHEKFDKLKAIYVKLRDEHVAEIRKKAEIEKKLASTLKSVEKLEEIESAREQWQQREKLQSQELATLQKDKELFNMETEILKKSIEDAEKERDACANEAKRAREEREEAIRECSDLVRRVSELENEVTDVGREMAALVRRAVESSEDILRRAVHELDDPAVNALTCGPDYLRSLMKGCREVLQETTRLAETDHALTITLTNRIAHTHSVFILQGRATSNISTDIAYGEKIAETCKSLGLVVLRVLADIKTRRRVDESNVKEALDKLTEVTSLTDDVNSAEKPENLHEMFDDEMARMDAAIEEAAKRIQDMLTNSRAAHSGIKLEVNEKILDTCTKLMEAIRILIKKSRLLQAEIVAQGRGTAGAKEFYKRNHQWTDGFISAAKAVAVAAQFLLTSADKVVTSDGKLEQLAVAAQEIAASTAQLVVASRVKADRNSENLTQLTHASKGVNAATGAVVATVKDCGQLIEESEELDVSNLSLHQAKRLEMESQVRVLELEKELEQERYRLAQLRRRHYQMTGDEAT